MLRRHNLAAKLEHDPILQAYERQKCRRDPVYWFNNWCWTFDPRAISNRYVDERGREQRQPAYMPFDLFPRQEQMVRWLQARVAAAEDGLAEKSRDIGFTWITGGFALHAWLFVDGFKTTFGSRKSEYVDRIGDPDSIFEKIRLLLYRLPKWMQPKDFQRGAHDNHLRLLNPANNNVIRGEGGDQMGRGGRSTLYIIDEAAFIERAERVEAATSANTDTRIWGSSVNGMGNLFARKRHDGSFRVDQIFTFHWSDDPRKTPAWAAKKKASLEEHVWASEYDIDYSASVEGICIPGKWVQAAMRLIKFMPIEPGAKGSAGLDVGAGKAKSVLVPRFGPVVLKPTHWSQPDTTETAHKAIDAARIARARRSDGTDAVVTRLFFDNIGIGKGVDSTLSKTATPGLVKVGINVGDPGSDLRWPDGEYSHEKFVSLKAELWWICRERFKHTWEHVLALEGKEGGKFHPPDELITVPSDASELISQISLVRWQRTEKGKIQIETKAQLTERGIASPDFADALMLTFCEATSPRRTVPGRVNVMSR